MTREGRSIRRALRITAAAALLSFMGAIIVSTVGCVLSDHRFTDPQGRRLEGVLVPSEKIPYILERWRLGAFVSDVEGCASSVDTKNVYIFKRDYYPILNGFDVLTRPSDFDFPEIRVENCELIRDKSSQDEQGLRNPVRFDGSITYDFRSDTLCVQSVQSNLPRHPSATRIIPGQVQGRKGGRSPCRAFARRRSAGFASGVDGRGSG